MASSFGPRTLEQASSVSVAGAPQPRNTASPRSAAPWSSESVRVPAAGAVNVYTRSRPVTGALQLFSNRYGALTVVPVFGITSDSGAAIAHTTSYSIAVQVPLQPSPEA